MSEQLFIVRNDEDDYEPGFIPLTEVASDPGLDATVVKARKPLKVMPYAVGSSAALKAGDTMKAQMSLGNVQGTCKQCHGTMREGDGKETPYRFNAASGITPP